jgi:serine/threonine protein kinase
MSTCTTCMRDVGTGRYCPFCGAEALAAAPAGDPYVGQTVAQKYLIHQVIGRGGMGIVYSATHLSLDRPVAVKMLNRALLADPTVVARFHREARAASRLNHPNSISILDFGQTEDGTLFMALEFLPGRTLARVITEEFPVQARRVVKIGSQILAALTEAHALGILHCDIKPENVMLEIRHDEADVVKVLDFGIAKLRDGSGSQKLTREGMACGTPGYASPEQARGEELDPRSDLYSVGVVLYELVSGKLPYEAATPGALLAKMLVEQPVALRRRRPDLVVPHDLEAVIMRALATDRQERFASAVAFRRELLACSDTGERPVPPPRAQATAVIDARPGSGSRSAQRPGRTATPPAPPAASRSPEAPRPTPRHRPASPAPRRALRETAGAMAVMVGSVASALLLGAGVWYGLSLVRAPTAPVATPFELPATQVVAPTPPPTPFAVQAADRPTGPAAPAAATAAGLEGVVTVLGMPGAQITVDGLQAGQSPRELRLPPGAHRIRLKHAAAGDVEETVQVLAGQRVVWSPASAR